MILLRDLAFGRGADLLVRGASLQLHPGWKIGLTGANGCGKSTFLALLRGEVHAERGDCERPPGWAVAHVAQDTPALPQPALEFALDGDEELRRIEAELVALETAHDPASGERIGSLHARLAEIDGYAARARAAALLHGLGFTDADFERAVAEFSGGWRVRLNLARALMCRSDLLLLDEPTNHLDLDAIIWLEDWLRRYRGTLLLISHDRDFLDAVCGHVLHIEQGQMQLYTGNYSACERARAERLAAQAAFAEKQKRQRAHLQKYVDRFRAQATKARQAQSRLKMLERMGEIAAAHVDAPFSFEFPEPAAFSDPLLQLDDANVGYGGTAILERIRLTLRPGSRIGLLGRNGAGKTTLMKLLAGAAAGGLAPLAGTREEGRNLKMGYFAQHQLEQLRPDESPLWHMIKLEPRTREQELRDWLGRFDFNGEQMEAPCGRFSGGEKSRLALALMIRTAPNLLLLDEPTNHLDLEMREALTIALNETEAGVVLVSHDRHLLRATCDELWLVADGRVVPFDGDLDDYAGWLAQRRNDERVATRNAPPPQPVLSEAPPDRREQRVIDDMQRKSALAGRRQAEKELATVDKQLAGWNAELRLLEQRLADPALYAVGEQALLRQLQQRQGELQGLIATAEERWLALHEQIDALDC
jgi:ATP-binding cassette subfamily F protein 3